MQPDINILPAPIRPDVATILWRFAWPFFLFSAVLAILLTISWTVLLPRYTRVEVGGAARSERDIVGYKQQLTAQIASQEEERREMVLSIDDPHYEALKEKRRQYRGLDSFRTELTALAKTITGKDDVIHWKAFDEDSAGTLNVRGDIRNVGTRSMTVLAEFASKLSELPFVTSHTTPAFAREESPGIGPHSPFEITLTLR